MSSVDLDRFHSRYGYHPCDYETYLVVRKLHRYMWKMCRELGRLRAYGRKQEHNRKGPVPRVCPLITKFNIEIQPWGPYSGTHPVDRYLHPDCWRGGEVIIPDQDLRDLYREARYPQGSRVEKTWEERSPEWNFQPGTPPGGTIAYWKELLQEIEAWYAS